VSDKKERGEVIKNTKKIKYAKSKLFECILKVITEILSYYVTINQEKVCFRAEMPSLPIGRKKGVNMWKTPLEGILVRDKVWCKTRSGY